MHVQGIHHVTAITAQVSSNLEFYTRTLGLRLVKKSVNQDDVSAYHLFYADAVATPGTDLTFFDWPNAGPNHPGPGTVNLTELRVESQGALDYWESRLRDAKVGAERTEEGLSFADPEGQRLRLVDGSGLPSDAAPWDAVVPAEKAIRGILGVEYSCVRYESSKAVLTELLGFREESEGLFEVRTDKSVGRVRIREAEVRTMGQPGAGGVHHVAFRVRDDDELTLFQGKLEAAGLRTSGFVNRFYFHSLYFREPSGVLFELATDGPGMHADEDMAHLGERLSLPPFLEARRAEIEAGLKPL